MPQTRTSHRQESNTMPQSRTLGRSAGSRPSGKAPATKGKPARKSQVAAPPDSTSQEPRQKLTKQQHNRTTQQQNSEDDGMLASC